MDSLSILFGMRLSMIPGFFYNKKKKSVPTTATITI